jgi:hypothetical protein
MTRSGDIGRIAANGVAAYLNRNGFRYAERRVLKGTFDEGDITGCPGLVFQVKGGEKAKAAYDELITKWLADTEAQRVNARADLGILVVARRGYGPARAGSWWAVVPLGVAAHLNGPFNAIDHDGPPVRMLLADVVELLRAAGYGDEPSRSFATTTEAPATRCDGPDTTNPTEVARG